jgi:hypothetical protein
MQTTKTVENVLDDIKKKHENALKDMKTAGDKLTKAQRDMALIKTLTTDKVQEIKKLCQ